MAEDVSKTTVLVLLVLTIVVSIIGTFSFMSTALANSQDGLVVDESGFDAGTQESSIEFSFVPKAEVEPATAQVIFAVE